MKNYVNCLTTPFFILWVQLLLLSAQWCSHSTKNMEPLRCASCSSYGTIGGQLEQVGSGLVMVPKLFVYQCRVCKTSLCFPCYVQTNCFHCIKRRVRLPKRESLCFIVRSVNGKLKGLGLKAKVYQWYDGRLYGLWLDTEGLFLLSAEGIIASVITEKEDYDQDLHDDIRSICTRLEFAGIRAMYFLR